MRVNAVLLMAAVLLSFGLAAALRQANKHKAEVSRLRSNQSELLSENRRYKVRDSLNAVTCSRLVVNLRELKSSYAEAVKLLGDMKIRERDLRQFTRTDLQSSYAVDVPIQRSSSVEVRGSDCTASFPHSSDAPALGTELPLIKEERKYSLHYHTPYIELDGDISDGKFTGEIRTFDTIMQIVHRVPRKFLFFRWGTKEIRQEVVSTNPHTSLTYSRILILERGRGKW